MYSKVPQTLSQSTQIVSSNSVPFLGLTGAVVLVRSTAWYQQTRGVSQAQSHLKNNIFHILGPHCVQRWYAIYFAKYDFVHFTDFCFIIFQYIAKPDFKSITDKYNVQNRKCRIQCKEYNSDNTMHRMQGISYSASNTMDIIQ